MRVHTDLRDPEQDDLVSPLSAEPCDIGVQSCARIQEERFIRIAYTLESQFGLFTEGMYLLVKDLVHRLDNSD